MDLVRNRLADQVHEVLRSRILTRELRPGERLSVPVIAAELATSRSPVREAVQRLVGEGLASERPNHGAVVAMPDFEVLAEMYEVRAPLDGLAAQLITRRSRPPLDQMNEAMSLHVAAFERGDVAGIIHADMDFHGAVARECGNRELWALLEPIHQRVALAILAGEPTVWPQAALREHQEIVTAIASGDPEAARQAAERHIMKARERILAKHAQRGEFGEASAG